VCRTADRTHQKLRELRALCRTCLALPVSKGNAAATAMTLRIGKPARTDGAKKEGQAASVTTLV